MANCLQILSHLVAHVACQLFFFFNDAGTTEIYTLSLHDALPISVRAGVGALMASFNEVNGTPSHANDWLLTDVLRKQWGFRGDRKSTRLNSSHSSISYAVFCLKKKNPDDGCRG